MSSITAREARPSTPTTPATPTASSSAAAATAAAAPADEPSAFSRLVHGIGREVERGEATVRGALRAGGSTMAPGDLLALQAGVYRYSEAVDLAAKLVDRASSGVRTVVQGQQ